MYLDLHNTQLALPLLKEGLAFSNTYYPSKKKEQSLAHLYPLVSAINY